LRSFCIGLAYILFWSSGWERGKMYYDIIESGKRIKELRKKAGLTQEQLAEDLGVSREALAKIETGKNGTSVDAIVNFASYFNVTTDIVIGIDNKNSNYNDIKSLIDSVPDNMKGIAYNCVISILNNFI